MNRLQKAVENLQELKLQEMAEEQIKIATAFKIMISTEGWGILLNTFEDMKEAQLAVLSKQLPGDDKSILAAHAVWASTVHTLDQIVIAVDNAIQRGDEAQQLLKETNDDDYGF